MPTAHCVPHFILSNLLNTHFVKGISFSDGEAKDPNALRNYVKSYSMVDNSHLLT